MSRLLGSTACNQACVFQGRGTRGAYIGCDEIICARDFWLGVFLVKPS